MNSQEDFKSLYSKLVDSLNCCICQDVLKDARDLSCGHTYCLKCIQELVGIRGWTNTIQCPQCRKETAIPSGGLEALKQNYKLNCIIEEQGMIIQKMSTAMDSAATAAAARPASREPEVQVFVRDFEGKTQTIMVRLSDQVHTLKRQVERKTGVPPNVQRLTFRSKQLEGEQTLDEYGLQLHSTIEMMLPLKGGVF